jgi:lysyl-tRNA synthetase class 2
MLFSKTIDITIIGVRGTVSERRWVKSVHIYTTVLAKALKPLPVVKTDADGKRTMHLQMNKGTVVVDLTVNDHVKKLLLREQNVQRHAFFL